MSDMINISLANAGITALLGYIVVFLGLVMLMLVVMALGAVMTRRSASAAVAPAGTAEEPVKAPAAKGTAGELKLYDTDPRDAAMVMAIVADKLDKPLNELRFISIKEVKNDEV